MTLDGEGPSWIGILRCSTPSVFLQGVEHEETGTVPSGSAFRVPELGLRFDDLISLGVVVVSLQLRTFWLEAWF